MQANAHVDTVLCCTTICIDRFILDIPIQELPVGSSSASSLSGGGVITTGSNVSSGAPSQPKVEPLAGPSGLGQPQPPQPGSSVHGAASHQQPHSVLSMAGVTGAGSNARPGSMVRVPEFAQGVSSSSSASGNGPSGSSGSNRHAGHSRNSSWDMRVSYNGNGNRNAQWAPGHSRTASLDMMRHSRNSSVDLNKYVRNEVGLVFGPGAGNGAGGWADPMRVQIIKAHHNWISVAYAHFVTCYRLKDYSGWQQIFVSPYIESTIERIAINAKMNLATSAGEQSHSKMVAISYGSQIRLWGISEDGSKMEVGTFNLHVRVEYLFFIGSQLVALSSSGKIGVWHAMTQHWQIQDLVPILSFDTAGSFLLLGCNNGSIYYIG